jgi:hypothetical protein
MALAHCGCGQAQRSFRPLPSAASEQAWLQYFSPAETGQIQLGWAQPFWTASAMTDLLFLFLIFYRDFRSQQNFDARKRTVESQNIQDASRRLQNAGTLAHRPIP